MAAELHFSEFNAQAITNTGWAFAPLGELDGSSSQH